MLTRVSDAPSVVPVAPGLFEDRDGTVVLLAGRCSDCGRPSFPRVATCCWCGTPDPEPIELAGPGTLWGWAVVHSAPPGYEGPVPYGMGVVELPEGLHVVTRVDVSDEAVLAHGLPVALTTEAVGTDADGAERRSWSVTPILAPTGAA